MSDTTFVSKITHILASWLNDVNVAVYRAIGAGGAAPTTPGQVINNLGLSAPGGAALIGNDPAVDGSLGSTVQAAVDLKAPKDTPTFTGVVTSEGAVHINSVIPSSLIVAGGVEIDGMVEVRGLTSAIGSYPAGFAPANAWFPRHAGVGAGPQPINASVFVQTVADNGATTFEWNQLNRLENYADVGENVGFYSQAYKHRAGSTWAGVFEAHDTTHTQPNAALYGLEVDVSANGSDISALGFAQRFGIAIVGFRDDPTGAINHVGNGILIASNDGDPTGTVFTNAINIACSGDIGLTMNGALVDGISLTGTYSTTPIRIATTSAVPAFVLDGSSNLTSLFKLKSSTFWDPSPLGDFVGQLRITLDNQNLCIPVYKRG